VRRTNGVKGDAAVPHGTHKKAAELLSSRFPVPSRKIAFLFGKAQDLQEKLFFTIQLCFFS
jgi:hypothetical protein